MCVIGLNRRGEEDRGIFLWWILWCEVCELRLSRVGGGFLEGSPRASGGEWSFKERDASGEAAVGGVSDFAVFIDYYYIV